MNTPYVSPGFHDGKRGEFSTVDLGGDRYETLFFPDDGGPAITIGLSVVPALAVIQRMHRDTLNTKGVAL